MLIMTKPAKEYLRKVTASGWLMVLVSLLHLSPAFSQEQNIDNVVGFFRSYHENALQEKIFIHTDKNTYIAGETVFFKVYAVDGIFHLRSDLSKVCYVELIDSGNKPSRQVKVAISNGIGNSSITLPDSLPSDSYRLIGYTSWMKNFSPEYFFSKTLSVINPLEKLPVRDAVQVAAPGVRFFPEGGNLVTGLRSTVAFQVTGPDGKGSEARGVIVNEAGDSLLVFRPHKFGIGSFGFTPESGKSYYAVVKMQHGIIRQELPPANDRGVVMNVVTNTKSDGEIMVRLNTNDPGMYGKDISLIIHSRHRLSLAKTTTFDSEGSASFVVSDTNLKEGISHLTIFDYNFRPLAERLYFKHPESELDISVGDIKPSYAVRTPVTASIETSVDNRAEKANLSFSVYRFDAMQTIDSANISEYLLLTSDLRGTIENPGYYLGKNSRRDFMAVDNLMLTHGWSRFKWENVMKRKYPEIKFPPENEGHTIRATVKDENDVLVPNSYFFLSIPSRRIQFYTARSNSLGEVQFYTRDLYGDKEIILQNVGSYNQRFNFNIVNPYTDTYPAPLVSRRFAASANNRSVLEEYATYRQVAAAFPSPNNFFKPSIDSGAFFGTPDKTYFLSDYVKFPRTEDVLREYVPEVIVRKRDKKTSIFVLNEETQTYFENDPLILVDGVPVFQTEKVIDIPAGTIQKLDIITGRFFIGLFAFNGIVSFTTFKGVQNNIQLNPEATIFDFKGMSVSREFYTPVYDGFVAGDKRTPDFRNVLTWQPDIDVDDGGKAMVKFYTSDLPGTYVGIIQGLSDHGYAGATTFVFEVSSEKK
jgi:hypothetical protein